MLSAATVSAPAKLVLTGEYAVLELGALAVVAAVDRWTEASVTPDSSMRLSAPALELTEAPARYEAGRWSLSTPHAKADVVSEALTVTLRYLEAGGATIEPFHLRLSPALAENGVKVGLGGSAATTVAVVAAVLQAFGQGHDPMVVYRLGAIAHLRAQGSGSGIDVAASAFGGVLAYSSHHPAWLMQRLAEEPSLRAVVEGPWPHLRIEPLSWPDGWQLMVGWTGTSASTPEFLQKVKRLKEQGTPQYPSFLSQMQESSRLLMTGLRTNDSALALQAVTTGRQAMLGLGQALGTSIETPMLTRLAQAASRCESSGKPSGAGGGDCGIALAFTPAQADCLRDAWTQEGIRPLDLKVAGSGVSMLA